jgi:hypothetical protein
MGKGATFTNDYLKLVFLGTAIANIADNAAASPLTNLQVALHTADPSAGDQTTNEISYTGYARVAVARSTSGWTVTGSSVSPKNDITFGLMTAGSGGTVTHMSIGVASSGASKILYSFPVGPNIVEINGATPVLTAGSSISES